MTPDQMRARSSEKVKQILDLMKLLNVTVEARERINQEGFIEKQVFWLDNENYPSAPEEPVSQEEVATEAEEIAAETPEVAPEVASEEAPA